jgi:hypothetical protein
MAFGKKERNVDVVFCIDATSSMGPCIENVRNHARRFYQDFMYTMTNDYNSDKSVGLPGKLFLQEDTGKQEGNDTYRRKDGSGNCVYTTQSVNVGELTCSLKNSSKDLVFVLRDRSKLDIL